MARPDLSRRVGKVVGYPPLCEMSDPQRREFHEALLDANTFEDLPGKWQAAILRAEENRPSCESSATSARTPDPSIVSTCSAITSWTTLKPRRFLGGAPGFPRGCRIKPFRKSCCAIAEMATRAAGSDDLGTEAGLVTDAMADF
jgi:hypothetical protein